MRIRAVFAAAWTACLAFAACSARAATVNVTTGAELAAAVANASDGLTITLNETTYEISDSLTITNCITIKGEGWDKSIIKMTANDKRVVVMNAAGILIEGVTITGGYNNATEKQHGTGIYMAKVGTVRNCRITGNRSIKNWTHGAGIAMVCSGTIDHCIIDNNTNPSGYNKWGGGIYVGGQGVSGTIDGCLIYGNTAISQGGGISIERASPKIRNCTFTKNYASVGGGIHNWQGSPVVRNCIFAGNTSSSGDTNVGRPEWAPSGLNAGNCLFATGVETNGLAKAAAGTNYVGDPAYTDPDTDDFHPLSSALSIDRGIEYEGMPETDLDGNARVMGNAVDIGCYEFDPYQLSVSFTAPNGGQGFVDQTALFTAALTGTNGTEVLTFDWTFADDQARETKATTANVNFLPPNCGTYSVSLTVTTDAGKSTSYALANCYYASPRITYVREPTEVSAAAACYPYDSWDTATTNLAVAVDTLIAGGTVFLDMGTHLLYEQLTVDKALSIQGMGMGATIVRPSFQNASIMTINDEGAVVSNMTITGFYTEKEVFDAGAVVIGARGGTVANCRITGNRYAQRGINHSCGVGIKLAGAKAYVHHCIIDRNQGSTSQYSDVGGGVLGAAGTLENCLVCCNTNYSGGGIGIFGSYPYLNVKNCTIVDNVATSPNTSSGHGTYGGGGIALYSQGTINLVNTIVYGNTCPAVPETDELRNVDKTTAVTSCFEDPFFYNRSAGNYRFKVKVGDTYSPAFRAGKKSGSPSTDLDWCPRRYRFNVDIGCYEDQHELGFIFILK